MRRVLRRGSKKGLSRRHLEGGIQPASDLKSQRFESLRFQLRFPPPFVAIRAACYRTAKPDIPKSAGESAGKRARKHGDCWGDLLGAVPFFCFQRMWPPRTALQQSPQQSPVSWLSSLALSPALLGDSRFLSLAGGPDCNSVPQKGT